MVAIGIRVRAGEINPVGFCQRADGNSLLFAVEQRPDHLAGVFAIDDLSFGAKGAREAQPFGDEVSHVDGRGCN